MRYENNMSNEKEHWDNIIKQINPLDPHYNGWLDKYFEKLPDTELHIVELGCGWGDDTSFLSKTGVNATLILYHIPVKN